MSPEEREEVAARDAVLLGLAAAASSEAERGLERST